MSEIKKPTKAKRGITDHQRDKLDILFQQIYLRKHPLSEISGENAELAHHFAGKPDSLRWWLPGGVSLLLIEHNIFHSSDNRSREFEEKIITERGEAWHKEIQSRKFKSAIGITYKGVMRYLNGDSADYI